MPNVFIQYWSMRVMAYLTRNGVSPSVSFTDVVISLTIFTLAYLALAVVDLVLMLRFARRGLPEAPAAAAGEAPIPAMQY